VPRLRYANLPQAGPHCGAFGAMHLGAGYLAVRWAIGDAAFLDIDWEGGPQ
jgi:hypothetical protein